MARPREAQVKICNAKMLKTELASATKTYESQFKTASNFILSVFHRGPFASFWRWTCLNSAMLGIFIAAGQSVGRLYTSMASYRGALEEVIKSFFLQQ